VKIDETASGVFIVSITPFATDGAVDLESTDRLVDFYLEKNVSGVTVLGMMGEAPKLTEEESLSFTARVLGRVAGAVPVVVGVSNPSLDRLASLARAVMDAGAAGVMVAPCAGLKTEEQILGYFRDVCGALADVPLCYQDYPQATTAHVSVSTLNRLVDELPQVVVLKHEDCPGLGKLSRFREEEQRDRRRRISVLVGNGGLYLPQELARGADGAMTGFAFPEMLVGVCERFRNGDVDAAEDLFDTYLPLVRYEQQPGFGLAVRKEILRRRGAIASARTRAPGPTLDGSDHRELGGLLQRLEQRLA
jgi:4-hydroxy-tetrahydrodipicolinate synthase